MDRFSVTLDDYKYCCCWPRSSVNLCLPEMLVKIVSISVSISPTKPDSAPPCQLSACVVLSLGLCQSQWPAGVSPAACPNYPDCSLVPGGYAGAVSQYPAGVWPAACPDYPYCSLAPAAPAAPAGNNTSLISLCNSFTNCLMCQVMSTQLATLQVSLEPPVPTTLTATS